MQIAFRPPRHDSRLALVRRAAGALFADTFFRGLAVAGRLHPLSRPERHGVEHIANLPYRKSGRPEHLLDIYRPAGAERPLPVVLYTHGGGFRFMSKDTHYLMGIAFAREGFLVVNINYRLAPRHPFPAAHADACRAFVWTLDNIARYGGDPTRLVLAGESAGANLATALTIASCYERPEPWAREVFAKGKVPDAVLPACGILQVSEPERFVRRRPLPRWLLDRLEEVGDAYLNPARVIPPGGLDLADPLVFLERGERPRRPLPPFFAPVGTADPLLDDTRRLARALEALGTRCEARIYPGEMHAFHAMLWRPQARRCWKEKFEFLEECLAVGELREEVEPAATRRRVEEQF